MSDSPYIHHEKETSPNSYIHMCRGHRFTAGVFFDLSLCSMFRQGFSLVADSTSQPGPGIPCVLSPSISVGLSCYPGIYMSTVDQISGPHTYTAQAQITEPSSSLNPLFSCLYGLDNDASHSKDWFVVFDSVHQSTMIFRHEVHLDNFLYATSVLVLYLGRCCPKTSQIYT